MDVKGFPRKRRLNPVQGQPPEVTAILRGYHYKQNDYRTKRIIFELFSVIPESLPNVLGILFINFGEGIAEPESFWNLFGNLSETAR